MYTIFFITGMHKEIGPWLRMRVRACAGQRLHYVRPSPDAYRFSIEIAPGAVALAASAHGAQTRRNAPADDLRFPRPISLGDHAR
jgi:hypothetical protein